MARLYLFAEGQTEQTFADTVLKPHLANYGVYMHNPVLIAHARKKGRVHRGGGRKFQPMQNDICRFLKQDAGRDVFFTTMIDLYALHNNFPGKEEAERLKADPYRWVEKLESNWGELTNDDRFIPFIQLHEYETYLFTDVTLFEYFFDNAESEIAALKVIADGVTNPEWINDGQQTAPSKRIINEFSEYEDSKTTFGPQIAELIGLEAIRKQCPHFDKWLSHLESLGDDGNDG